MIYPAFAAEYDQIVSTSDGTLDVGIYTIPAIPNTEDPTKLKIDFLKSGTEKIQLQKQGKSWRESKAIRKAVSIRSLFNPD